MTKELVAENIIVQDAKLFIDGKYVDALSGETFDTINPATNKILATVANGGEADAKWAIDVAQRTFVSGVWSTMPVEERSRILCKMADLIMENVDKLAYIETVDVGKPIKESREFDIPRAASNFRFFAEMAKYQVHEHYDMSKHMSYVQYAPAGVTSLIIPWNLPFMQLTWKASAALAAGNTVVSETSILYAVKCSNARGNCERSRITSWRIKYFNRPRKYCWDRNVYASICS